MYRFHWYEDLGHRVVHHTETHPTLDAAVKAWHDVVRMGIHPTTIMPA